MINRMGPGTEWWTENDLAVITFNYDRSFEHYFTKVIDQRARLPDDEAHDGFSRIVRVLHVHGFLDTHTLQGMDVWALAAAGIFGVLGGILLADKPPKRIDAV